MREIWHVDASYEDNYSKTALSADWHKQLTTASTYLGIEEMRSGLIAPFIARVRQVETNLLTPKSNIPDASYPLKARPPCYRVSSRIMNVRWNDWLLVLWQRMSYILETQFEDTEDRQARGIGRSYLKGEKNTLESAE
jgi:hypothetical protein